MNKNVLIGFCAGLFFCCVCCCISFTLLAATGEVSENLPSKIEEGSGYFEINPEEFSTLDNKSFKMNVHEDLYKNIDTSSEGVIKLSYIHKDKPDYSLKVTKGFQLEMPDINLDYCKNNIFDKFQAENVLRIEKANRSGGKGCYFEYRKDGIINNSYLLFASISEEYKDPRNLNIRVFRIEIEYLEDGDLQIITNLKESLESFEIIN